MKKIILDTNFIMEIARNKINLKQELDRITEFSYKIFKVEGTDEELEKIAKEQKMKERETAKLAIKLIEKIPIIKAGGKTVDDKIEKIQGKDTIIATQDKELKKKIEGQIIIIRQKKHLQLI